MIEIHLSDNLELMKKIKDQSIDLIYSDILYGTGKKYPEYEDILNKKRTVKDHYWHRIHEMHRILKPTGSIYLQMDTRINHWIRDILDYAFGEENFRNEIVWIDEYKLKQPKNKYTNHGERILFYTKSNKYTFNIQKVPHKTTIAHQEACRRVPSVKSGKYKAPYSEGKNCGDVWDDIKNITYKSKENTGYSTQKPEKLIERIILASSNPGDMVADFYMGSGTTAVISERNSRDFIGCDNSKKAIKITTERVLNEFGEILKIVKDGYVSQVIDNI